MEVFAAPAFADHEQVLFCHDRAARLNAIIAIHDTSLGPAVGGCRMWPYRHEAAALDDALRLSRGMTRKAALAGLPVGGGMAVIIGDPAQDKSEALFTALGRAVEALGGACYAAQDVGTARVDMEVIARASRFVLGLAPGDGEPALSIAQGVRLGIKAAVRERLERADLRGVRVAVQGLGEVGSRLAGLLAEEGASLVVADRDPARTAEIAARCAAQPDSSERILASEADVLAPCALGGVINERTIGELRCAVIAGAANDPLSDEGLARQLQARGILYAPDDLINGGGLITIAQELAPGGYDRERASRHLATIERTLIAVFERARREGCSTLEVANRLAGERLHAQRRRAGPWRWGRSGRPATGGAGRSTPGAAKDSLAARA